MVNLDPDGESTTVTIYCNGGRFGRQVRFLLSPVRALDHKIGCLDLTMAQEPIRRCILGVLLKIYRRLLLDATDCPSLVR